MASEQQEINEAIDRFAAAMKARMGTKRKAGWRGWQECEPDIENRLLTNAARAVVSKDAKSCVDAANFAMMIWMTHNSNSTTDSVG